jgi:nitrogen fixation/metabolism regulation signal transduction histidine kinase
VPGLLVFTISAQFLTRSIESWFDVRVESALDRGLELGKGALNYVLEDVARKSRVVLDDIDGCPASCCRQGWSACANNWAARSGHLQQIQPVAELCQQQCKAAAHAAVAGQPAWPETAPEQQVDRK